jgi:aryl-alcohol dehydrogenase-like predicted oxidoreductase
VRYIGLSECSVATLERAVKAAPITAVQWEYSLFTRDAEEGVLDVCRRHGMGFVSYSPLGRGFLTGAIQSQAQFESGDYRHMSPRFVGDNFAKNLKLVDKVKEIATAKGVAPGNIALAWLMTRYEHLVPLFGTKRRTYLDENVRAVDVVLTADERAQIDASFPRGIASGARYPDSAIGSVNR